MTRAKRIYSDSFPYHITARCINKEWFEIPIEQVWEIFSLHLYFCHYAFNTRIHAFTLMSNHFHLLMSTPLGNISEVMRYLMTETSREITRSAGRINQTYGGPYFSSLITTDIHYRHVYKYLYRNPIEAGIVTKAEMYRYSTLNGLLGHSQLLIPISEDSLLFKETENTLRWINTDYQKTNYEHIQQAIRKTTFKFKPCPTTRKENPLNFEES